MTTTLPTPGGLGRYVITGELGRGGMGVVYRAHDPALRRDVAIKRIDASGPTAHTRIQRFQREAIAVSKLGHPGIVSIHEVGLHEGSPYLVMELVDGVNLERWLETCSPRAAEIAALVGQVAAAVQHAHDHAIVHRDIKPENILVGADGRAKVVDFGLARDVAADDARLTASGQMIGTPSFMAPEQALGRAGDARTDVYGIGAVLYRALTGTPPFTGDTLVEVIRRVVVDDPAAPRSIDPTIHADLETIALRCLEKAPERRYPTAAAVAADLDRFVAGEAIEARPIGRLSRLARRARRQPSRVVAIVLGIIVAIGVPAGLVVQSTRSATASRTAAREERASLAAAARAELDDAWSRFAAGRDAALPDDAEMRRRFHDALLGHGLRALTASQRLASLDVGATDERTIATALEVGRVATEAGAWSVAASALDTARLLAPDDERVAAGIASLERARRRRDGERRAAIVAILDRAEDGELDGRLDRQEDALFELVRLAVDASAVATIVDHLDRTTNALRAAATAAILEVATPTEAEAAAGRRPRPDLADLVDRWLDPASYRGEGHDDWLGEVEDALDHLLARAMSERLVASAGPVAGGPRRLIANRQRAAIGAGATTASRLCCDALGRVARSNPDAIAALARFLLAQQAQVERTAAALALIRAGGPAEHHVVAVVGAAVPGGGPFADRVAPPLTEAFRGREMPRRCSGVVWLLRVSGRTRAEALTAARRRADEEGTDPAAWTERGRQAYASDLLEEARRSFERALELDPDDLGAHVGVAELELRVGSREAAEAALARAAAVDPDDPDVLRVRGGLLTDRRDYEAARTMLERSIELFGAEAPASAWYELGRVRQLTGDAAGALDASERALALEPTNMRVFAQRVRLLAALGRRAEALAEASRGVALAPGHGQGWYERARLLIASGDHAAALDDLTRAEELAATPQSLAPVLLERSRVLRALGRLDEALDVGDRLIEVAPDVATHWVGRSVTKHARGDLRGAFEDANEGLRIDPEHLDGWVNRAGILMGLGRSDLALTAIDRAIEVDPRAAHPRRVRGKVLLELSRWDEAIDALNLALEIDPDAHDALVWLGEASKRSGDLDGALAAFGKAIEVAPGHPHAWALRGRIRYEQGDLDAGDDDLIRALELNPSDAFVWLWRADIAEARGDRTACLAAADRAVASAPGGGNLLLERARRRHRFGDAAGAREDVARCAALGGRWVEMAATCRAELGL